MPKRRNPGILLMILLAGFAIEESCRPPVAGAKLSDWNPQAFCYYPWACSCVRKGVDIFATRGTTLGTNGNVQVKPPHLHYPVLSQLSMPWSFDFAAPSAWLEMFCIGPNRFLTTEGIL